MSWLKEQQKVLQLQQKKKDPKGLGIKLLQERYIDTEELAQNFMLVQKMDTMLEVK